MFRDDKNLSEKISTRYTKGGNPRCEYTGKYSVHFEIVFFQISWIECKVRAKICKEIERHANFIIRDNGHINDTMLS